MRLSRTRSRPRWAGPGSSTGSATPSTTCFPGPCPVRERRSPRTCWNDSARAWGGLAPWNSGSGFDGGGGHGGIGGGSWGEQYFYGDEGYGPESAASDARPVGDAEDGGSHWDGRELDGDLGFFDGYSHTRASSGSHTTEDSYGNGTTSGGGRAGAEIGFDGLLGGEEGPSIAMNGRAGGEAYSEGGMTTGPDGLSIGGGAGIGVYADFGATFNGIDGSSIGTEVGGYAGAEAHANFYAHNTRNDEGQVNGFTFGADAGAFMGAKGDLGFETVSPGGWLSASGSLSAEAGVGVGGDAGAVISTDQIGFSLGGDIATGLGFGGDISISIHPNEIVNDIFPGDYDLDDMLSDASGSFEGARDFLGSLNPFD